MNSSAFQLSTTCIEILEDRAGILLFLVKITILPLVLVMLVLHCLMYLICSDVECKNSLWQEFALLHSISQRDRVVVLHRVLERLHHKLGVLHR